MLSAITFGIAVAIMALIVYMSYRGLKAGRPLVAMSGYLAMLSMAGLGVVTSLGGFTDFIGIDRLMQPDVAKTIATALRASTLVLLVAFVREVRQPDGGYIYKNKSV